MKYRFLLLTIILLRGSLVWSQGDPNASLDAGHLQSVIPITPNAASLAVYADYPNAGFTGVPSISIPLYEAKAKGLNIPISLSYNASGIKIFDIPSWVGLGWSLNAGGVISR